MLAQVVETPLNNARIATWSAMASQSPNLTNPATARGLKGIMCAITSAKILQGMRIVAPAGRSFFSGGVRIQDQRQDQRREHYSMVAADS